MWSGDLDLSRFGRPSREKPNAAIIPALFFILLMIWDLRLIEGARWLAFESIPMFPGMVLRAILPGILALLWCRFRGKFRKPPDNPSFRLNWLYMRPSARSVPFALAEGDALGRILPPYRVYLGMSLLTAVMLSTGTQMIDALKPAGGYVVSHIYTLAPTKLMFGFDVALGVLCAAFPGDGDRPMAGSDETVPRAAARLNSLSLSTAPVSG